MGPPKLYPEQVLAKFRPGTVDGINEVLLEGQTRAEFMRHWVEYGIEQQRRRMFEERERLRFEQVRAGISGSAAEAGDGEDAVAEGAGGDEAVAEPVRVAPIEGRTTVPDPPWVGYVDGADTVVPGSYI